MWVIQHVSVPELCEKQPLQHKHVQVAFQRLAQVETFSNEAHYEELEVQTWQAGDEEEKDLAARGVAARSPVFMPENDWNVPLHLSKYARYISRFFFYPRRPRPRLALSAGCGVSDTLWNWSEGWSWYLIHSSETSTLCCTVKWRNRCLQDQLIRVRTNQQISEWWWETTESEHKKNLNQPGPPTTNQKYKIKTVEKFFYNKTMMLDKLYGSPERP